MRLSRPLDKYKLGLAVIGLLTFVLLIIVLVQSGGTRHDAQTYKKANAIAAKLNDYITAKGAIPASLDSVDRADESPDISYQKLSDTSYKFCVTYKTTSTDFNATSVEEGLATAAYGQDFSGDGGSGDQPTLYIDSSHHKGQNCQTIKPYLFGGDCPYDSSDSQSDDLYCYDLNNTPADSDTFTN